MWLFSFLHVLFMSIFFMTIMFQLNNYSWACNFSFFVVVYCCCLASKLCPILLQPHGLYPARVLCPWNFPSKNTGVGCHFLLQGIFLTLQVNSLPPNYQGSPFPVFTIIQSVEMNIFMYVFINIFYNFWSLS